MRGWRWRAATGMASLAAASLAGAVAAVPFGGLASVAAYLGVGTPVGVVTYTAIDRTVARRQRTRRP